MFQGKVISIYISPTKGAAMTAVDEVKAIEGVGLDGDRYAAGGGTFSKTKGPMREVTLIESEAIEAAALSYGVELGLGDSRRNVVTRGVPLNHLVGRHFRVGDVVLEGLKLCEPCGRLEKLTQQAVRKAFAHRGGLRARVVSGGSIRNGDEIRAVDTS
ncbi:MAG: MOSC domain-containing protein [Actinomycetota bacterium]|nr:MOSC domain-containing protein [Actinomycetota bacterium]